jgi:hypothetical protein
VLADCASTAVHVARYPLERTLVTVAGVSPAEPLDLWCARHAVSDAISGGFMVKPDGIPLGYLRTGGTACGHHPFSSPWAI